MNDEVKRTEHKYYIPLKYVEDLKFCLGKVMLEDKNNKAAGGYKITSLYFDTLDDLDFKQKLDGIIYREKYRIRIYDSDKLFGKFEVKRKLNQVIEKISIELSESDIQNIISGNYSILKKYPDLAYVAYRMKYKIYKPKTIVEYLRQAYYLPINNIRVTVDSNLSSYGFKNEFSNIQSLKSNKIQKLGYEILEVKFNGSLPSSISEMLSAFPIRQSAISKYALSRVDNNTEPMGDNPVIPF
tara:strand:- start:72 stop:794 length:723 start_codon:yes stop_codon:yes gene_type:complete